MKILVDTFFTKQRKKKEGGGGIQSRRYRDKIKKSTSKPLVPWGRR